MSLKTYHHKRNFNETPEPAGKRTQKILKSLFVVQKHDASHLHYDFRLEMNGVLKSWAVPKGPSLDPTVKRLAVHVEDHPLEYGSFKGIIPKGHYGAGTVEIWDTGSWEPEDEHPYKAYKNGSLSFSLKGKKLKGRWKLIQIKSDPKHWLLMKLNDDNKQKTSKNNSITKTKEVVKKNLPSKITPQLATLVQEAPTTSEWLHETKYDGYRLTCIIQKNTITLKTRNNLDWTKKFLKIVKAIKTLKLTNTILDGEIVVVDKNQKSDFQLLQNSIKEQLDKNLLYYLFDIIYYDGYDLSNVPLIERKLLLKKLLSSKNKIIKYSSHQQGKGDKAFHKACKLELEGIISKKIDSPYIQKRTHNWLKVKCVKRQEFVIGGFTPPKGQRTFFGALLLGYYDNNGKLKYCGRVGTGFTDISLEEIAQKLNKHRVSNSSFEQTPPDTKQAIWVKPVLIAEIEFSEWTSDGILRHPSFKGLRNDKAAAKIRKEIPMKSLDSTTNIAISHPDRILYPDQKFTKQDIANYYEAIESWIMPFIINRPLTLMRCPQGIKKSCFFQKHIPNNKNKSLYTVTIKEKKSNQYLYIKDLKGILSLIQLGVLELHTWNCKVDNVEKPDMIIFDLDPAPDVPWSQVVKAAHCIKSLLEKIDLVCFVKVTGGKGLHIVIPIVPKYPWDKVKAFSHAIVDAIVQTNPKLFIGKMTKSARTGKIFIDYLRNQKGATAVAPYSTRARDNAPVAAPIAWSELNARLKPNYFNIKNLPNRLKKLKSDPWAKFYKIKQHIKL